MKLVILKVFIFLSLTISFVFAAGCQNEGNDHSFHKYDLSKLVKKSLKDINISQSLKLLSEENIQTVKEFEKFLPVFINSTILDVFSETFSNKCVEDLKYTIKNLPYPDGWAMKMLDSYGKPGSGILAGNIKWIGQYDECVGIQAPPNKNMNVGGFRGKYCTLQIPLKLGPVSLPISTALCLPDSCNPNRANFSILKNDHFNGSISALEEKYESIFDNATLTCQTLPRKLTTGAIVVIFFLSVFSLFAVIGSSITAFEYYVKLNDFKECGCGSSVRGNAVNSANAERVSQGDTDEARLLNTKEKTFLSTCLQKCKPFFNCFCIFTNGERILNTSSSEGQLPSLHGIRFLSMTWVILCHTYGPVSTIVNNARGAVDSIDRWTFEIVINGFFSVDSFFVLSGFLVGYLFFQQAQKTDGKIPWLYFYIHRYIRLTPVYMIVLFVHTTIEPFLGSGPFWPDYDIIEACKGNWWWNALYINNFLSDHSKQCMAWSWYLANDMQFYIISPLFLISLWRWPKAGYSLLGLFFSITFVCNFVLTYEYNLISGVGNIIKHPNDVPNMEQKTQDFYDKIYVKPYTRIGPYLIGLALAYYVIRRKLSNSSGLNWVTLSIGWIIASGIALACQFGLYHQDLNTVEASFYNSLSHVGFGLGLGWVIFVCVIGQGGVVNSILSWKALIPLSRLTYSAYLIHPVIMEAYFSSVRTLINFSHINVIMLYLALLIISYAVALVTSLLFESPVIRLEKLIRNKFAS